MSSTDSSHKSIFGKLSIYGGVQVLKILISLITTKFIALFLGKEGIGLSDLLSTTLALIGGFISLGIPNSGIRQISLAHASGNISKFSKSLQILKRWSLFLGFLYASILILFHKQLSVFTFGTEKYSNWFLLLSVNAIVLNVLVYYSTIMNALRLTKKIAQSSLYITLIIPTLSIPIYYFYRIEGISYVIIISGIATLLVNMYFTRDVKINKVKVTFKETLKGGKDLISLGIYFTLNSILIQVCAYIIRWYIGDNGNNVETLGLFATGNAILISYVGLIFNALLIDYFPSISAINEDNEQISDIVNKQVQITTLIVTPSLIGIYLFIHILIQLLYTDSFLDVVTMMKFGLLSLVFKAISWPLPFIFLAKNKGKYFLLQEVLTTTFNIIVSLVLYHHYGLFGIGIALTLIMIFNFGIVYPLIKKKYNISFSSETIKSNLICVIFAVLSCAIVNILDYPNAYYVLPFILIISIIYSYKNLDDKIGITDILINLKNKYIIRKK
ncbi:MAG: oligosaccharide flippase family protein [Flavobacteriales bacterium]|nr:oligosaccharide flippase family protein [Flavobacteriales bacterium]